MREIVLNKEVAHKIGIMIFSRLIWYKHYYPWCDEIIEKEENPPYWIIELATTKYIPTAVSIINSYVYSELKDIFNSTHEYYIACLILKYERSELSWATFLESSGIYTDGNAAKVDCEYFYYMLNDFENSEYDRSIEIIQRENVYKEFEFEIEEIRYYYEKFKKYFKQYIKS